MEEVIPNAPGTSAEGAFSLEHDVKEAVFEAVFDRLCAVTKADDWRELADALDCRCSEIAWAIREAAIPFAWLFPLWERERISPRWILYGEGPERLPLPATPGERAASVREMVELLEESLAMWQPQAHNEDEKRLLELRDKRVRLPRTA
ncbi:hypothetical protein [uncultured Bilophila sp.]|uniref:hypothetical protein n=1 Tax=uncultured Bilophila sp. TaxID=529385 RepID=UPI0026DB520B|nr:hypothetical protein [uncultured Bilophila sp.]